ncbi:MAG: thioredoxin fold domain-containing protein [Nautiliaceae bacterium]|jgi:thiol:disulfide interchange protein DsbC
MKKIFLSLSLIVSLFAYDKLLDQKEVLSIIKKTPIYGQLKKRLNKDVQVKGTIKDNFYIITLYNKEGEQNIYITKDLKYTILGMVVNNKTLKPLMPNYKPDKFSGNKDVVKNGIVFSFGKGKDDIYVVTDPECPFCRQFEKMAKKSKMGEKYRIHVIFLPLSFHKHAMDMIYYILSAETQEERVKRFNATLSGDNSWKNFKPTKEQKVKIDKEIEKSKKAAYELGAKGTPSFYDKNFNEIENRGKLLK